MKLPFELIDIIIKQTDNFALLIPLYKILSRSSIKYLFMYKINTYAIKSKMMTETTFIKTIKIMYKNEIFNYACKKGFLEIIKLMISKDKKCSTTENNIIEISSRYGHLNIIEYFVNNGWYEHDTICWSIFYARTSKCIKVEKFLQELNTRKKIQ
jgi:hypothetical protein